MPVRLKGILLESIGHSLIAVYTKRCDIKNLTQRGFGMFAYFFKRLLVSLLTLILVSIFAFSIMQILPGDPVRLALGEAVSEEKVQEYREEYGLNDPFFVQYFNWVKGIVTRWDFGQSIMTREKITDLIGARLPVTFSLGLPAFILGIVLGMLLGIVSAVKRGGIVDNIVSLFANLSLGVPQFWIAIMGVYILSLKWHLIPLQGYVSPSEDFAKFFSHAIWPIFCISTFIFAVIARQTRSNILEVIQQDYVRTARANGIKNSSILFKHTLKNALIPVVTIIGVQMRMLVCGSIIIESVFNIPGLGNLLLRGVTSRDYFIVQACVLLISIVTVLGNFLVDLAYGILDPRIRKGWG